MMRVWIVFWVAVFLLLDALDKLADCCWTHWINWPTV